MVALAAGLAGCCSGAQCAGPDGTQCNRDTDCRGSCVEAVCREPCSATGACGANLACWSDPGADAGTCLPPALPDELWRVSLVSVEQGPMKPFLCLVLPSVTLCSEEETGPGALFTRSFVTVFTTTQLAAAKVTLWDSKGPSRFTGCEGSCSLLEVVNRTVVFTQDFDARPLASRKKQSWSLATDSGAVLHFSVNP